MAKRSPAYSRAVAYLRANITGCHTYPRIDNDMLSIAAYVAGVSRYTLREAVIKDFRREPQKRLTHI